MLNIKITTPFVKRLNKKAKISMSRLSTRKLMIDFKEIRFNSVKANKSVIMFTEFYFKKKLANIAEHLTHLDTSSSRNIAGFHTKITFDKTLGHSNLNNLLAHKYVTNHRFYRTHQILNLNFTRGKFFPSVRSFFKGNVFVTLSLGLFWKYFMKPKCFKKSKTMYLTAASFLRKILLYCSLTHVYLYVNRTPRYFNEILAKLNEPSISVYNHPLIEQPVEVVEQELPVNFVFSALMFFGNKKYGLLKPRKRGRLKRKIFRRLVAANRVLD